MKTATIGGGNKLDKNNAMNKVEVSYLSDIEKTRKIQNLTVEEQIEMLKAKDLIIRNEKSAVNVLKRIGYHRLSGYFQFFIEKSTGNFYTHTTFEDVENLYRFDSDLRLIYLELMQEIEISLKSYLVQLISTQYTAHGWRKEEIFVDSKQNEEKTKRARKKHFEFMNHVEDKIRRFERDRKRQLHRDENNDGYPIQVITEILDFGSVSKFYKNLQPIDKQKISDFYIEKLPHLYLENWMEQFVKLRNICSHHAQVVGRGFKVKKSKEIKEADASNLYALTLASKLILNDCREWKVFQAKLVLLLINNPIYEKYLDFPSEWIKKI